jgi:diaminopimelate epimerase
MSTTPFCKFHGFGNDYIVIMREATHGAPLEQLATRICSRNTGAGSDGIAVLERSSDDDSDYFCEIVNPDGSVAGFSGNGTRCAAAFLYHSGRWVEPSVKLATRTGVKNFDLIERRGEGALWFDAEIGVPRFKSEEIPFTADPPRDHVVNEPLQIAGRNFVVSAVNVGNPVACIFVDNFDKDWRELGRALETHQRFPDRVNAVFVRVLDRRNIEIRIWERGAGETTASGTCSSGAAVLSSFLLKTDRQVSVHSPGGVTEITWRADDKIVIRGCAEHIYCGEWPL